MKLIDLLANELTTWPEQGSGCNYCVADSLGEVYFGNGSSVKLSQAPEDHETARVTKTQWQATRWTGQEGSLPPVGTVCEVKCESKEPHISYRSHLGQRVRIVAHDVIGEGDDEGTPVAVYHFDTESGRGYHALIAGMFRPIRTAEQMAAEERIACAKEFHSLVYPEGKWHKLDDAARETWASIYDAGYRKQEAK